MRHRQTDRGPSRHRSVLLIAGSILLGGMLLALAHGQSVVAQDLSVSSSRYIVVDAETGEVFEQYRADERVAIASLTKMFTTIEALERGILDQVIVTNESDLFDASSTVMGFGPGEEFTLEDLLYGMLLPSGNDAAHAVARSLGYQEGDSDEEAVARFVGYMNERAANMGLQDTQFVNPSGWGEDGHYSSARDVATFAMHAARYETFLEIIATSNYTTADGNYTVSNTNKLLSSYDSLIGGKTGYDDDAGYCLVEFAQRGGTTLVSVTLDGLAPDIWYDDNVQLLEYGFTAKDERIAANQPIGAETLGFRDPDAAVILANAEVGASLGQPLTIGLAAAPSEGQETTPGDPAATSTDEGNSWSTPLIGLLMLAVALAVGGAWLIRRRARDDGAHSVLSDVQLPPLDLPID